MNLGDQRSEKRNRNFFFLTQILLIRPEVGWEECISPLSSLSLSLSLSTCTYAKQIEISCFTIL